MRVLLAFIAIGGIYVSSALEWSLVDDNFMNDDSYLANFNDEDDGNFIRDPWTDDSAFEVEEDMEDGQPPIPNETKTASKKITVENKEVPAKKIIAEKVATGKTRCNKTECSLCKDCIKEIDVDFPKWTGFRLRSFEDMFREMDRGFGSMFGSLFGSDRFGFGSFESRFGDLTKGLNNIKHSVKLVCETKGNGTDVSQVCKKIVDGVESVTKKHKKWNGRGPLKICSLMDMCDN